MCECIRISAHKAASVIGFREPAAKGATVRGIRAAEASLVTELSTVFVGHKNTIYLSNVQW